MDVGTIAKKLNLEVRSASDRLKNNVTGGYTGDLLSDVMANSHAGDIWITRKPFRRMYQYWFQICPHSN
jgi:hypothetical protein